MTLWARLVVGIALLGACGGDEPPGPVPTEAQPPGPEMDHQPGPAPASEVAYARAVVRALAESDWEGYTNLLVTRADMIGVFASFERDSPRKRRNRRRLVWRRVNQLRGGEAETGWKEVRRSAFGGLGAGEASPWGGATIRDVRRIAVEDERLPPGSVAARLLVVVEREGATLWLDLGTCVRTARGWVTLHSMSLRKPGSEPPGESLLHGSEASPAAP